jgi:hypothetical protein
MWLTAFINGYSKLASVALGKHLVVGVLAGHCRGEYKSSLTLYLDESVSLGHPGKERLTKALHRMKNNQANTSF